MGRKRARPKPKTNVSDNGEPAANEEDPTPNKKNQRKNSRNNAKSNNVKSAAALRLSNKPGKLTRADIMCPICWSSLFEPTTLPCNHSICEACFRKHIVETSITCPICRLRLSVWCRKVMKENKLLDEPLWNRIKKQFPRLVDARMNGLDTQNILDSEDDDDEEDEDANSLPQLDNQNQPRRVLDGVLCETSGEIAAELQQMIRQHQEDLDNERLRTETASASLIQQLQEEENDTMSTNHDSEERDFLLAKELQEKFQAEERRNSTLRSSTQQPKKSIQRNLVKEWAKSDFSPDITDLPLRNPKPSPRSSLASNSSAGKRNIKKPTSKKRTSTAPSQSPDVSRASQEIMNKFFSFSQNKILPDGVSGRSPEPRDPNLPCCSKSLVVHDVNFSAFSPMKASGSSRLFVPVESLAIPISSVTDLENSMNSLTTVEEPGTISKTPDSIKSEVERHFRPIRCAPKTPPRCRPDGTFLPEPKLMKTTPVKPSCSALISAYIRSPLKQLADESDRAVRPSCATIEKRISNDSGRASDDSRSPDVDGTGESPISSCKVVNSSSNNNTRPYRKERGCPSEDYRVTPEDAKTPENSKKRFLSDDNEGSGAKKVKLKNEPIPIEMDCYSPEQNKYLADLNDDDDEEEHCSPSLLDDSERHVPLSFDITCTQGIMTIDEDDEEYKSKEEKALILFRQKAEQEAADRAYAENLQRELDGVENSPNTRNSREKYSLRSWLNPAAKPEVKRGSRVGK